MTDATDDLDNRPVIQETINLLERCTKDRRKKESVIKTRIEQIQAHLDEGGNVGEDIRQELLGYIIELK